MASSLDPSTLQSFDHAAAGHDGVMTDEDNTVVIKPCTAVEIDFYQQATARYPRLAYFMPQFMGTLQLQKSNETAESSPTANQSAPAGKQPPAGDALNRDQSDPLRLKGKALDTDTCIVLSAVTAGFKKPNVLDLKLGSRLWADDAPPAKRQRLDKVSAETSSGPLGFRIAGMRVWQGDANKTSDRKNSTPLTAPDATGDENAELEEATNYLIYNKWYGRALPVDRILHGFENYLLVPKAGIGKAQALRLLDRYIEEIEQIRDVLFSLETRMYSSSLLLVYEGDPEAHALAATAEDFQPEANGAIMGGRQEEANVEVDEEDNMDEEDIDDEEETPLRSYAIKMIDFAHASSVPGQGPDENILHGIRSILKLLDALRKKLPDS